MIKTVNKNEFGTKVLRTLAPGDQILILCENFKDMNAARSLVNNHNKLYPEEMADKGILTYRTEKTDGLFNLMLYAVQA